MNPRKQVIARDFTINSPKMIILMSKYLMYFFIEAAVTPVSHNTSGSKFDYESFYNHQLEKKHKDKSYRYFNNINRLAQKFPRAHTARPEDEVTVWCANDYLGMGRSPVLIESMK